MDLQTHRQRTEPWLAPISDSEPAGTDARYDPAHEAIRNEVGKLESPAGGDVDWRRVVEDGGALLSGKSKDLLIGGYVAAGLWELERLDGLSQGLVLLSDLMERYWETLFPGVARLRARANALSWTLERVNLKLPETPVGAEDHDRVAALAAAGQLFARVVGERFGDQAPAVRPLLESIERLRMSLPARAEAAPQPAAEASSNGSNGASAPASPASPAPVEAAAAAPAPAAPAPAPAAEASPLDALRERIAKWTAPIPGGDPAGTDARYDPLHEGIRNDVGQLESPTGGTVRWREVVDNGTTLLAEKSKDLLIATYVAHGLYELEGIDGLAVGLLLLADLQEAFWEGMQPPVKRIRGRANALSWMLDRLDQLAETKLSADDEPKIARLEAATKRFADVTRDKFADEAPALRPLQESVQRMRLSLPAKKVEAPPPPKPAVEAPKPAAAPAQTAAPSAAPAMPAATAEAPADAAAVGEYLRKIGVTLVQAGGMLRRASHADATAYRIVRVGLYLHLASPPPAQQGSQTLVPAPPQPLRQQLATLTQNGVWTALLDEAEGSLNTYRFWLDLQRYVAIALGNLGATHAAAREAVIAETATLLRRMPAIVDLAFSDGSPFASPETREWIGQEVLTGSGGAGPAASESPGDAVLAEARALVAGGKAADAIEKLQDAVRATSDGRVQFRARLTMARACVALGKPLVAQGLYAGLLEEAGARRLDDWEPQIVSDVLTGYLECLKALGKEGRAVTEEVAMVYRRLSRVDPTAALKSGA